MKFNKATMITMSVTAAFTIAIIAIINNTKSLNSVSNTVNGGSSGLFGWW